MGLFFLDSDFEAFDEKFGKSEDTKVIAKRKVVVEQRFRNLHESSLKSFFLKHDLHAHWQPKLHLTNVYYPLQKANRGSVTYLRMGYGKEEKLVKLLGELSGVYREITSNGYEKDVIAFHCVTQLQIALDYYGWDISLYIDRKAWMEQHNIVKKINSNKSLENELKGLLDNILDEGYQLFFYEEEQRYYCSTAEDYIYCMKEYKDKGINYSLAIIKEHKRDDEHNNLDIDRYLKGEFKKLIPLYEFMSWNPTSNNYLGI